MEPQLIRYLERAAELNKAETGVRFLDRSEKEIFINWPDYYDRVLRSIGALYDLGVRSGDRVAIILPTCPEFLDVFLACQAMGAVPAPMYPPVRLGRLDEYFQNTATMLKTIEAVAIVSNKLVNKLIGAILPLYSPRLGIINVDNLHKGTSRDPQLVNSDDLAMVQFSSGTTVAPKAVALSHRQMIANANAIIDELRIYETGDEHEPSHHVVSWLPLYHDMGLIGGLFPTIIHPCLGTFISPEIFLAKPAIWLRAISRYGASFSVAPNFAFGLCTERIKDSELQGCDLSSWIVALCGAEPVSLNVMKRFADRFSKWGFEYRAITPVYGLSEASLAVTFSDLVNEIKTIQVDRDAMSAGKVLLSDNSSDNNSDNNETQELVSVGPPIKGFSVEIRNDQGSVLAECFEGEVFAAGPSLCMGYFGREDSPVKDDWLATGDVGFLYEGELYITGRKKDVVIINGKNHAPHEIECVLDDVPGMRVGCAVAVGELTDEGEKLLVFAEYRTMSEDLAEHCKSRILSKTKLDPALLVLLEPGTLPRTSSGKIRRAETLRLWRIDELTAPEKVTPWLLAGAMASSISARFKDRIKR